MTSHEPEPAAANAQASKRHSGLRLAGPVLAGGLAYAGYAKWASHPANAERPGPKAPQPIPVALVRRDDLPLHSTGFGTVIAFKTVTIPSLADGQLIDMAFKSGPLTISHPELFPVATVPFNLGSGASLSTAVATLARGSGMGWELRQPLGFRRYRGIGFQPIIDLCTTPAVYVELGRIMRHPHGLWRERMI